MIENNSQIKVSRDINKVRMNGWTDGWAVHFMFPDLADHTTTCDTSSSKIKKSSTTILPTYFNHMDLPNHTTVCGCVHVRDDILYEVHISHKLSASLLLKLFDYLKQCPSLIIHNTSNSHRNTRK